MKQHGGPISPTTLAAVIVAAVLFACGRPAGNGDHPYKGMAFSPGPTTKRLDWLVSTIGEPGVPPVSQVDLRTIARLKRVAPPGRGRYLRFAFIEPEHTLVVYDGGGYADDPQGLRGNTSFRDLALGLCGNVYYFPADNTENAIPDPDPCWGWTRQKATAKP